MQRIILTVLFLLPVGPTARATVVADPLLAVAPGLGRPALEAALRARNRAVERGHATSSVLAVIDYSLPSTERRLWVLDTDRCRLLFHELVAHGRGSGDLYTRTFSNVDQSHQSSLGVFVTGDVYVGRHGRSLRLQGLEEGFNDHARDRALVLHGAEYATADFVKKQGRLGRSWGCPAVAPTVAQALIDTLGRGSVLVSWYPDGRWLKESRFVGE